MDKLCGLQVRRACETRWWTEFLVCERVLAIYDKEKEALNTVIKAFKWTQRKLTKADHDLLRYYVEFFQIFKEKSDMMSGEEFCNIHFVHSTVKYLRRHILKWSDHAVIGSFVKEFSSIFSEYFDFIDNPENDDYQEIYSITAFLSPYHQAMLSNQEKARAKDYLASELALREVEEQDGQGDQQEAGNADAEPQAQPQDGSAGNFMPGKQLSLSLSLLAFSQLFISRYGSSDGSN